MKSKCVSSLNVFVLFLFFISISLPAFSSLEKWRDGGIAKSLLPTEYIDIEIENNILILQSFTDVYDITILISGDNGMVYTDTMPGTATGYICIDLAGMASGVYQLLLTNQLGGFINYEFAIE